MPSSPRWTFLIGADTAPRTANRLARAVSTVCTSEDAVTAHIRHIGPASVYMNVVNVEICGTRGVREVLGSDALPTSIATCKHGYRDVSRRRLREHGAKARRRVRWCDSADDGSVQPCTLRPFESCWTKISRMECECSEASRA